MGWLLGTGRTKIGHDLGDLQSAALLSTLYEEPLTNLKKIGGMLFDIVLSCFLVSTDSCHYHPGVPIFHDALKVRNR